MSRLAKNFFFLFFFRRGEEFEIIPVSSELLFYPENKLVTISGKGTKY